MAMPNMWFKFSRQSPDKLSKELSNSNLDKFSSYWKDISLLSADEATKLAGLCLPQLLMGLKRREAQIPGKDDCKIGTWHVFSVPTGGTGGIEQIEKHPFYSFLMYLLHSKIC